MTFHKGTSTEELQLNSGSTQLLSQTQNLTQEVGTKPSTKQRKIQLGDHKDHKQSLGDLESPQTNFLTKTRSYR